MPESLRKVETAQYAFDVAFNLLLRICSTGSGYFPDFLHQSSGNCWIGHCEHSLSVYGYWPKPLGRGFPFGIMTTVSPRTSWSSPLASGRDWAAVRTSSPLCTQSFIG